jgi:hypothetical protein
LLDYAFDIGLPMVIHGEENMIVYFRPGLTVVGGTEHIPESAAVAETDSGDSQPQIEPDGAASLAHAVDAMNAGGSAADESAAGDASDSLGEPKPESQA